MSTHTSKTRHQNKKKPLELECFEVSDFNTN